MEALPIILGIPNLVVLKLKILLCLVLIKIKYINGKNGGCIHCTSDYGPWFCGGSGVYLDYYFKTNNSYQWELNANKGSFDGFTENFELVGGIKNFSVNEVEVFKVEYI